MTVFLMIYLTIGNVYKGAATPMSLADAQALQTLLQEGGNYTVVIHNSSDGTRYTA